MYPTFYQIVFPEQVLWEMLSVQDSGPDDAWCVNVAIPIVLLVAG